MRLKKGGTNINHLQAAELTQTTLTGLFGYPVEHSFSPPMHNAGFEELDLNYLYLPFSVAPDSLKSAVESIRSLDLAGVNLTIPHKESVIPYLDQLSPEAELIGAVNTIVNEDGTLVGYNTDGQGFLRSLTEEVGFVADGKTILIIGAGGAARAVAFQLAIAEGKKIYITNRTEAKAKRLATEIQTKLDSSIEAIPLAAKQLGTIKSELDLLVDTTPVGMAPEKNVDPVVKAEFLSSDLLVADLVYNPRETVLLKEAKKAGAQPISGLGMLLYQGVIAFEQWTNQDAPVEVMRQELINCLANN